MSRQPDEHDRLDELLRTLPAPEPSAQFISAARRRYLAAIEARARREALTGLAAALVGLAVIVALMGTVIEPVTLVGGLADSVADLARWTSGLGVVLAVVPPVAWAPMVLGSAATVLALALVARAIRGAREISGALDRTPGRRESDMSARRLILGLAVTLALLPGLAWAATPDSRRLEGRLPDNTPAVSIDQTRGTVLDALSAISRQTGWSLVVTAPENVTGRTLAIQVSKKPAAEALELVLEAGALRASFADGILRVRPDVGTAESRDGWRERRRERRGRHGSERVVFGRSLDVGAEETISKAVAIGGSVTVAGRVRQDAVAIGGSVTLLPGARVEGDAVAVGGTVSVEPGAILDGDNVSLAGTIPTAVASIARWAVGGGRGMRSMFGFASRMTRALLLYVLALLIAVAFPGAFSRVKAYLVERPGLSALGGLAIVLGFAPLCVLLAVTIIGIPLIPVAALLLVALLLFGFTVAAGWLGERMPWLSEKTPVKTVALGGVVLALVSLLPWLGTAALMLVAAFAAGAALLSRFGRTGVVTV